MSKVLKQKYDFLGSDYGPGRSDATISKFPRNRFEAVLAPSGQGNRVLDVGCGNGYVLYNLRRCYQELYGIEIANLPAQNTRNTLFDQNAFITIGNIDEGLPYKDNTFDLVVMTDVIEHVVDVYNAFQELHRVLLPGGRLIVTTPNVAYFKRRITLLRGRFPGTSGYDEGLITGGGGGNLFAGGHFQYFTFRSLRKTYEKFGIRVVREMGFGRLGRIHNLWRTMLSGGICIVGTKEGAVFDENLAVQKQGQS